MKKKTQKKICKIGNPILSAQASEVKHFGNDLHHLVHEMFTVMRDADGVGLAAPQIGVPQQVFVYDIGGKYSGVLINPWFTWLSDDGVSAKEGCLSVPGKTVIKNRHQSVVVSGFNLEGDRILLRAHSLLARIFQHEIDHLNGILIA